MRLHRYRLDHLSHAEAHGRNLWREIQYHRGLPGRRDIDLALERGELHCRVITIAAFFGREPHIGWFKKGFTRPFVQTGRKRDAQLPETPTLST